MKCFSWHSSPLSSCFWGEMIIQARAAKKIIPDLMSRTMLDLTHMGPTDPDLMSRTMLEVTHMGPTPRTTSDGTKNEPSKSHPRGLKSIEANKGSDKRLSFSFKRYPIS